MTRSARLVFVRSAERDEHSVLLLGEWRDDAAILHPTAFDRASLAVTTLRDLVAAEADRSKRATRTKLLSALPQPTRTLYGMIHGTINDPETCSSFFVNPLKP